MDEKIRANNMQIGKVLLGNVLLGNVLLGNVLLGKVLSVVQYTGARMLYLLTGILIFSQAKGEGFAGGLYLPFMINTEYFDESEPRQKVTLVYCDEFYRCLLGRQCLVDILFAEREGLNPASITMCQTSVGQSVLTYDSRKQNTYWQEALSQGMLPKAVPDQSILYETKLLEAILPEAMLAEVIMVLPPP